MSAKGFVAAAQISLTSHCHWDCHNDSARPASCWAGSRTRGCCWVSWCFIYLFLKNANPWSVCFSMSAMIQVLLLFFPICMQRDGHTLGSPLEDEKKSKARRTFHWDPHAWKWDEHAARWAPRITQVFLITAPEKPPHLFSGPQKNEGPVSYLHKNHLDQPRGGKRICDKTTRLRWWSLYTTLVPSGVSVSWRIFFLKSELLEKTCIPGNSLWPFWDG